jgi:hypothetical protein
MARKGLNRENAPKSELAMVRRSPGREWRGSRSWVLMSWFKGIARGVSNQIKYYHFQYTFEWRARLF